MATRIDPLAPPFPPEMQALFERLMPPGVPPLTLFTTLARSPRVFDKFMAGGLLDKGPLSLRERELMIDRTSARLGNQYEWGVHVALFAARARLTADEIAALASGPATAPLWSPREQLILRLADELHETARVSDALWTALAAELEPAQILELMALAGFYRTVAYFCNGLALPLEPFAAPLPR